MAGESILLVDDDPEILGLFQEFLTGRGYAVTGINDGRQAMAALETQEFALALLDLMLPGCSGLELLAHLKAHTPDTEVILFTGYAAMESALQALRLGAYDYLLKTDLSVEALEAVVARALERRRLARENRALSQSIAHVQGELAHRRIRELDQVRRIAETLAGPLTWDQLLKGLSNLVWESLTLDLLGIEIRGKEKELPLSAYKRHPEVPEASFQAFQDLLQGEFMPQHSLPPRDNPLPAMLWERVEVGNVVLAAGIGRQAPFTPEEKELFQIFILQGEAGIKNLVLFDRVMGMAIRDALTGLYNYGYFREALHYEVEKSRRYHTSLALLFMDIDDFKLINDTLGHVQGDHIMRQVGAMLKQGIRQADLLCRYGGDEFVCLLSQTSMDQAMVLAERLRRLIDQSSLNPLDQGLRVTISIGVTGLESGMSAEDLIKSADAAHYLAKQEGKNRVSGPQSAPAVAPTARKNHKIRSRLH
jgi:two-component system, cell cycle response regulator